MLCFPRHPGLAIIRDSVFQWVVSQSPIHCWHLAPLRRCTEAEAWSWGYFCWSCPPWAETSFHIEKVVPGIKASVIDWYWWPLNSCVQGWMVLERLGTWIKTLNQIKKAIWIREYATLWITILNYIWKEFCNWLWGTRSCVSHITLLGLCWAHPSYPIMCLAFLLPKHALCIHMPLQTSTQQLQIPDLIVLSSCPNRIL